MGRSRPTHVSDPRERGARIKDVRTGQGLSLRDVAFPGCSASFLSRVEAGLRVPSTPVLIQLAGKLSVPPEQLLGRRVDGRVGESAIAAAEVAARLGDESADRMLDEVLEEARELDDTAAESRVLERIGELARERRQLDRAVELLERALACDPATGPRERPSLHRSLGRAYADRGDLSRAIAVLEVAFDDASSEPVDPALIAQFGIHLANAFTDQGRFAEAEQVLAAVLRHESSLSGTNALRVEWALARTYAEEGRLAIAETYTRRVLARMEVAEETMLVGRTHLLLAGVLLERQRIDDAVPHLDQSERLLPEEAAAEHAQLSLDRARVALATGDADAAEGHAREALNRSEVAEPGHAGAAYGMLAEVELARSNLDDARFLCREALELMSGAATPVLLARVYDVLAAVEERAGNLEAALAALRARPAVWAEESRLQD
ncbi:MAG: helix-turn-helix domain-containing protein [Gaiellales bacterium]